MFSPMKVRLSSVGFRNELEDMMRHGQVSDLLADVLTALIERRQSKRKHAITDLPLMSLDLQRSILHQTDEGRFSIDREGFQFCMVISKCHSKPPRIKMVRTECPSCYVCPL